MTRPTERVEAIAIGRAITTVVALWLIAAGLVVCLTAEQLNGARLIGGPALAFAGLALLVRLIRVRGARCEL